MARRSYHLRQRAAWVFVCLLIPAASGAAIAGGGVVADGQTSLAYDAATGVLALAPPSGPAIGEATRWREVPSI